MADLLSTDVVYAIIVLAVAGFMIFLFWRASKSKKEEEKQPETEQKQEDPIKVELQLQERKVKVPPLDKKVPLTDIEKARGQICTLTLKQEINSMVLRRLFEAEDEGEINREERGRLGKSYEDEMKLIAEDLKRNEMLVSLADLESIREEIVKKFEDSLNQTQLKIDSILKELKIEIPKPVEEEKPKTLIPARRRRVVPKPEGEEPGEEGEEEAEGEKLPPRGDVESRLEQLKKEVMKELDELDKLELEA